MSGVIDQAYVALELWWLGRSTPCRWFVGCTLAAVLLGLAGGILG